MDKISFQNERFGNTEFEIGDGQVSLRWLFGLPMNMSDGNAPERLRGIADFDFGQGGCLAGECELIGWDKTEDELKLYYEVPEKELEFLSTWKIDRGLGILSRKDYIMNHGDEKKTIYKFQPKFLFASGDYECYVQNNTWCYEGRGGWETLGKSGLYLQSEGGRTTQGSAPFLGIREREGGLGVAIHLVPKGNWEIRLSCSSMGVGTQGKEILLLRMGQASDRFACELEPDGMLEMPELIIEALPDGKLHKGAPNLQKWLKKNDLNPNRVSHRLVYNPWYACYDHIDEKQLLKNAQIASQLGCEIFEVDAGWYGQGEDWSDCVGDWREKQDGAFYGKLKEFSDRIRALGMGFGLWMEPERCGLKAPVYLKHPEWFSKGSGDCRYLKLWEKEPYEYIKGEMLRLIKEYQLVWMKLDFNFELEEDETRTQFMKYYESWYRLIDEVKELHPEVFMEACASGGLRSDISTMRCFDAHFLCDNVSPFDGQSMYEQLLMRTFPNRIYQWLAIQKGADIPAYFRAISDVEKSVIVPAPPGAGFGDHERIDLDFLCKLMFRGMVGISGDISTLEEEELALLKAYIQFYKEFRELLEKSTVTLGSEPMKYGERNTWRTLDFYWEEKDEHLLYAYRFGETRACHHIRLTGLKPRENYWIMRKSGREKQKGDKLLQSGISVELSKRDSGEIIYIRPAGT